jgi:hypothetical protein
MKRQNSSTPSAAAAKSNNYNNGDVDDDDDHSRNTHHDSDYEMMSPPPPIMTTPYNRLGSSHGRRRKLLSNTAEKRDVIMTTGTTLSSSSSLSLIPSSSSAQPAASNSPSANNDANTNIIMDGTTNINSYDNDDDDDEDTSKKRKKQQFLRRNLLTNNNNINIYQTLHTKVQYYRKKLSNLTPRQKVYMCVLVITWKFVQAWLIVRGVVWLSGGGGSGANGSGQESADAVVKVGRSMEQRMNLDRELEWEIGWSKGEEERLMAEEQRLWMEEEEEEEQPRLEEGVEEMVTMTATRILYMVTVTCSNTTAWQYYSKQHETAESSSTQQQQQQKQKQQQKDGTSNIKYNKSIHKSTGTTNIDNILSTLSTNIQTMISHHYTVDVYWILGCTWSDYNNDLSSFSSSSALTAGKLSEDVSQYWKAYIAQQLPNGVGLQIWEDAMPLDYDTYSTANHDVSGGSGGGSVVGGSSSVGGKGEPPNLVGGSSGVRGSTLMNPQGQIMQQGVQTRRLGEEEEVQSKTQAVPPIEKTGQQQQQQLQGRQASHSDNQLNNKDTKKGEKDQNTLILSPSIEKFMKQHRYVVRDKLDYYDVFLSFGASLQQQQLQYQSSVNSGLEESRELITVNGTNLEFCTKKLYRDTEITCSERVEYMTKRYHLSKSEAMTSLLKGKDCTCNADGGGGSDVEVKPSHSLERITGDHIHNFLTMSSELNELQNGQYIIPGFLSVDAVPVATAAAANNNSGSPQIHVDASPCCKDIMSKDSIELTVETKGVTINTDEWQMMKVAADSSDADVGKDDKSKSSEWIAVESASGDATTPMTFNFYEDGWILTKDQLLRLDYGVNRGKFLPPFTSDNNNNAIHNNVGIQRRGLLTSPLFESRENGGFDLRRAVCLDPNRLSRQLVHPVSPTSTSRLVVSNESLEVNELLRQFHTMLKRN